jgi:TRAP transporter TAXI family solute receptor
MRPAPPLRRSLGALGALAGLAALAWLAWLAVAASAPARAQDGEVGEPVPAEADRHLVIGTAPVAGHYYPAGGALCRVVNARRAQHGLRCLVEATAGAEENLTRLAAGDLDFALVPSDWQYHAYRSGLGTAGARPFAELRAVLSLQALSFTLLAAPESGVDSLDDLAGKRVNLGPAGSPWRSSGEFLIAALGWSPDDFAAIGELGPEEQAAALCDGRVDALLLPASHPSGPVVEATDACGARLLGVNGAAVDRLLGEWPFYAPAVIPGGLYANNPEPVASFGLRATLVTTQAQSADTVYRVTETIFEGLDELRAQHAVLAGLGAEDMAAAGLSAPLHEGALRYFRERGWR